MGDDIFKAGAGLALGAGTVTGLFFAGRSIIRKDREKNAGGRVSDGPGSPAQFAQRLSMSFKNCSWWGCVGTNEAEIYRVVGEVPDLKTWNQVEKEYQRLYRKSLSLDIESELDTNEYLKFLDMLNSKPKRA